MRPELIVHHKVCADAYSGFVIHDPKRVLYQAQIDVATNILKSRLVAKVYLSVFLYFCFLFILYLYCIYIVFILYLYCINKLYYKISLISHHQTTQW
jgi:hypothetical protein